MKVIERLVGNSGYLFLDSVAAMLFSIAFYVIVWKNLPPEAAGVIATSVNMIILLSTFGIFGMHGALTKLISEYSGRRKEGKISALIKFSNKFLFTLNLAVAAGLVAAVALFGLDLKIPFEAVLMVAAGVVIWPITHATTSIISGFQNMRRIFLTDALAGAMKVAAAGASIYLGYSFLGPLGAIVLSFASLVFMRLDVLQIWKRTDERIDTGEVIRKYALPGLAASLSWALFINTPTIILTVFDSLKSSGLFAAAMSITNPLTLIPAIIAMALLPITSYLTSARNHSQKQARLFSLVIRYAAFVSVPMVIAYLFFAKALVLVFAQLQYLEAVDLIPVVGVAVLIQGIGQIFLHNLFALGKTSTNRNIYVATAGIFLALSVPLTISVGIEGMLWGFFASVVFFLSAGYFFLKRALSFETPWRSLGKVGIASASMFLVLFVPASLGMRSLELVPFLIAGSVLYLWGLGRMRFYVKEDAAVLRVLERKVRPLSGALSRVRGFVEAGSGRDL